MDAESCLWCGKEERRRKLVKSCMCIEGSGVEKRSCRPRFLFCPADVWLPAVRRGGLGLDGYF